jgi:putative transposase
MPNHIHLIVLPATDKSLGKAIGRTHYAYTQSFHTVHGGNGQLWQGRYYSTPLDENHLVAALAYVDLNPVRAHLAQTAQEYQWSSARAHVSGCDPNDILDLDWWKTSKLGADWDARLSAGIADDLAAALRDATISGQPPWQLPAPGDSQP